MVRGGVALFQGTERFELVAELGSGAMGTVFKVLDRETDSYAALKLLETRSHEALRRFKREFRSIQGIQHPNLVSLHELVSVAEKQLPILRLSDGSIVTGAVQIRKELAASC